MLVALKQGSLMPLVPIAPKALRFPPLRVLASYRIYYTEDDDAHLPFYDSAVKRSLPFTLMSFGHSPRQRGKAKGKGYLHSSLYKEFSVVGLK